MKQVSKLWLILVILAPLLTYCSSPVATPPPAPTAAPTMTVPKDAHTVTIATLEWPPYVGERLEGSGFATEIVKTAFERAGYKVVVTFMPWARVLQETENGKYDIAFPAYYSEERAQKYIISEAFAQGPVGFYKRKGAPITYTKLEELQPYHIGVVRGYVNTPEFDAASYLQKEAVDSDEQNLRKLLLGRIDLAIVDKFVAQSIFSSTFPEGKEQLEFMEPPLDLKPMYIMASRQIPDGEKLIEDFNASLKQMTSDGTIDQIMAKFGLQK